MKEHLRAFLIVGSVALLIIAGVMIYQNNGDLRDNDVSGSQRKIQINQDLPDFEAKDLNGKPLKLSQFKGKVVIVNFWASWCAPCIEEVPSLLSLIKTFPKDIVLLAVSGDSTQEDIDSFMKSFPEMKTLPNSYVIWDADKKLSAQFEVLRLPESFIAGRDLKLVKKLSGTIDWHTPDAISYLKQLAYPEAKSTATLPVDTPQDEHTGQETAKPGRDQK